MLTIYAPFNNKKSKAWEVFDGVKQSWPEQVKMLDNSVATEPLTNSMYLGICKQQHADDQEARRHVNISSGSPTLRTLADLTTTTLKPDNHYWRICRNKIHASYIRDCKPDRFEKFGLKIKAPNFKGSYILVCPSSAGINNYLDRPNWTEETVEQIKRYTDRPIRIREKPRGRGTSGPSEATVPLSEDLKDAWVCVTSCSISAVEAQCMGIPTICDEKSFALPVSANHLNDIENPFFVGAEEWLYSLAYQQFTPEEFENGKAVEILIDKGIL